MSLEEIKKNLEKGQKDGQNSGDTDLKAKELEEERTLRETAQQEVRDLKFNSAFDNLAATYPHAKDLKDEIRKKFDSGYEADDAVISVLQKNNKLITADQISREENKGTDLGGSADRGNLTKTDTGEKTLADIEKEFKELEAKGEIKLE